MPPSTPPAESGKQNEVAISSGRGLQQTVAGGGREAWEKLTQPFARGDRAQYGIKTARKKHDHSGDCNRLILLGRRFSDRHEKCDLSNRLKISG